MIPRGVALPLVGIVACGGVLAIVCLSAGAWPAGLAVALQCAAVVVACRSK